MTATREHLPGLELALESIDVSGCDYMRLKDLIAEAQSAPEPVQGEAVDWVAWTTAEPDGDGGYQLGIELGADQPDFGVHPLMTVAQHNRIMAAAKPDAELVESLMEALKGTNDFVEQHSNRWDGMSGPHPNDLVAAAHAALAEWNKP